MSDRLLYTLSTRGSIRLEIFHALLEDAAVGQAVPRDGQPNFDLRRRMARLLDALGHCEFDYEQRHVWACPPSLILLPAAGLFQAVLSGARTPSLLRNIKNAVQQRKNEAVYRVTKQKFGQISLPAAIAISATSIASLREIATVSKLHWIADEAGAFRLGAFSASLEQIASSLTFSEKEDINWPRRTFSTEQLTFTKDDTPSEIKLVSYTSPIDHQLQHWLWEGARAALVDREWGRFLILNHKGMQVMLYDARRQRICVPSSISLPPLFSRALTLCSGHAPAPFRLSVDHLGLSSDLQFHVYAGVPAHIADLVANKLGQTLMNARCEDDEATITPC